MLRNGPKKRQPDLEELGHQQVGKAVAILAADGVEQAVQRLKPANDLANEEPTLPSKFQWMA